MKRLMVAALAVCAFLAGPAVASTVTRHYNVVGSDFVTQSAINFSFDATYDPSVLGSFVGVTNIYLSVTPSSTLQISRRDAYTFGGMLTMSTSGVDFDPTYRFPTGSNELYISASSDMATVSTAFHVTSSGASIGREPVAIISVTEKGTQLTAEAIGVSSGAVPETDVWVMMIAGIGMSGAALRRRRLIPGSYSTAARIVTGRA